MPSNCSIYGCKNTKARTKDTEVRYFRFPRKKEVIDQWAAACGRPEPINVKHAIVCSIHFEPSDFKDPEKSRLQALNIESQRNVRALHKTAVPTLHLPEPEPIQKYEEYFEDAFGDEDPEGNPPPATEWNVEGRLDLRKNKRVYCVTIDELRRRRQEKFIAPTYVTYLRRPHREGIEALPYFCRDNPKKGRKVNTVYSSFTPLVEGEVLDLAEDLKTIISTSDLRSILLSGVDFDGPYSEQMEKIAYNAVNFVPGSDSDRRTHGFLGVAIPFIIEFLKTACPRNINKIKTQVIFENS